jgi:Nickel responsive protein SCO4226-like
MYTSPSPKVQQSVADVAAAHEADLKTQTEYGVRYLRYWVGEKDGKVFCLADALMPMQRLPSTARRTVWLPTRSMRSSRAVDARRWSKRLGKGRDRGLSDWLA